MSKSSSMIDVFANAVLELPQPIPSNVMRHNKKLQMSTSVFLFSSLFFLENNLNYDLLSRRVIEKERPPHLSQLFKSSSHAMVIICIAAF